MNKIKTVIIEDEYPAARLLSDMVRQLRPEWSIEILSGNIEESVAWFASHPHPDILFLDIQLADGNSFFLIEQADPKSMIIFTTAYDEYAVRAFSVNSIDYLLKPISKERLEDAILKFERLAFHDLKEYNHQLNMDEVLRQLYVKDKKYRTRFLLSLNGRLSVLQVDEIAYFFSENKLTYACTFQGKHLIVDKTLSQLEDELDPSRFFRVNRQFVLSVDAIKRLEPYFNNKYRIYIFPEFQGEIYVSREKITLLKNWLDY